MTVDNIGMWVDPSELSISMSTHNPLNGPLLHFGGFQDEHDRIFENAYIPDIAAAYKEPIDWGDVPETAEALLEWTYDNFCDYAARQLRGLSNARYVLGNKTKPSLSLP
jgi:hypothetical protein